MKTCLVCGALSEESRCPDHPARPAWRTTTTTRTARGYDNAWLRMRAQVLAEEPSCRRCGRPAAEVDHIMPLEHGGARLDRSNLQPLCDDCHTEKTIADAHRGRRRKDRHARPR